MSLPLLTCVVYELFESDVEELLKPGACNEHAMTARYGRNSLMVLFVTFRGQANRFNTASVFRSTRSSFRGRSSFAISVTTRSGANAWGIPLI